ncbi:MAG: LD-carboxypeptidase [Ignavibacteriota bacterium]
MKAKALQPGDTIGIIAPASAPQIESKITRSVRYFERLGFNVEIGKHIYKPRGYLAAKDSQRLEDLHAMFRNKAIRAIFFIRGGYGTIRLLPEVDYELIKRNPKIIVGYSDATALFNAIYAKTGLESMFFGPMAGVDIWKNFDPFAEESMWKALTSTKPLGKLPSDKGEIISLRRKKFVPVTGKLMGGNLAVFSSIMGTPFVPDMKDRILLFEDIAERPYKIDRYLAQLRAAGILSRAKAVLLGQFCDCEPEKGDGSLSIEEVFHDYFDKLNIPVLMNLPSGHIPRQWTLPMAANYRINGKNISITESVLQ